MRIKYCLRNKEGKLLGIFSTRIEAEILRDELWFIETQIQEFGIVD